MSVSLELFLKQDEVFKAGSFMLSQSSATNLINIKRDNFQNFKKVKPEITNEK